MNKPRVVIVLAATNIATTIDTQSTAAVQGLVYIAAANNLHFFSFFNLTYSRWTSSLPSCLWSLRIFPSLPGSRLNIFLSRCKFSTLITRQLMVEFYLLTFPRFPLRKKEHKSYFGKNRLTTSVLAGVQVTYTRPLGRATSCCK